VSLEELGGLQQLAQPHLQLGPELRLVSQEQSAEERAEHRQRLGQLTAAISTLPDRLQMLLSLYYVEEFTYREIARLLEVSEARVCQLHGEAIALLRQAW
jgi:RNA polymerase sigma factor for flagellar operon FliA